MPLPFSRTAHKENSLVGRHGLPKRTRRRSRRVLVLVPFESAMEDYNRRMRKEAGSSTALCLFGI
jgi:hypothetical protein